MNLIKSFNFKYLKENIKKSKGLIILLLIVVPLLTTLFTVLFVNGEKSINLASEVSINWVNMIGIYIVPIGISFALFGYIYKKTSVDLINSMPLNKQTIFVTNTIGGIALITIMQLITVALLFICSIACSNLVIFGKMLIDIFIVMWVAYVFVFVATNLAMAVSGTFLTQLVLTALILFLIPFITINIKGFGFYTKYAITTNSSEKYESIGRVDNCFIAPIQIPLSFLDSESSYIPTSLAKTIFLGVIYLVIGLLLFKRRKMEDSEESFRNEKIHLFVKALTVFPMIVFLNMLNPSNIITIFIIAIISIYYFAYDFIVKRKVKLITSIVALILTLGISYVSAIGLENLEDKIIAPLRKVNINDIRAVSISIDGGWQAEDNYFMENEELLKLIFSLKDYNRSMQVIEDTGNFPEYNINVIYKTKTGKMLKSYLSLYSEEFNNLVELLSKDEKYVSHIKEEYTTNGKIAIDGKVVSKEFEEELNLKVKEKINSMTLLELYNSYNNAITSKDYYSNLSKSHYNKHKFINKKLDIAMSEEIAKMVMEYQNKSASEYIKNMKEGIRTPEFRIVGELLGDIENFQDEYGNYYDTNYFVNTRNDIIKFVKDNENIECNPSQEFYQIYIYDYKLKLQNIFYTNKIDEINEILKKEYNAESSYYIKDAEIVY